ncbi:MAG: helicase-exonuclease AddAB subunit AddB [Eubacteriales bacterium]
MGLKFIFGSSGAGKSTQVYEDVIRQSMEEPNRHFFIIVPDQFTMQTQMELVKKHPNGGIMNIDVLSFTRLAYRIFQEVGGNEYPVLDDTGKSLVLKKVAENKKQELSVLGSHLKKMGYIQQVKSAISEFMQYGIGTKELEEMIGYSKKRGTLQYKLKDLSILYDGFLSYIQEKFITTEESMTRLAKMLPHSEKFVDSVVVLDGFTGFTPVQKQVIGQMFVLCKQVNVTITIDPRENPCALDGEHNLFYLSKKTVDSLSQLAHDMEVKKEKDLWMPSMVCQHSNIIENVSLDKKKEATSGGNRFLKNQELAHLEQQIFRYPSIPYDEDETIEKIHILEATTVEEEIHMICVAIRKLVKEEKYRYGDIAVIVGDMGGYSTYIEKQFHDFEIPFFIDQTRKIILNPFIEYIKSGLQIVIRNFSYESVFHYLKSGLVDFTQDEIDLLENYVLAAGIRGKKAWSQIFVQKTKEMVRKQKLEEKHREKEKKELESQVPQEGNNWQLEEVQNEQLEHTEYHELQKLNAIREKFMEQITPLLGRKRSVEHLVEDVYTFIVNGKIQEKLEKQSLLFRERGELERAKEYTQIYPLVMDLLDQMVGLIGEETVTMEEFGETLQAGFEEIQVGLIPGSMDRVVVGDVERTRLQEVKTLFFMGINDGLIPKKNDKSGIISDLDREFLLGSTLELAPTPRQQMYIQKLYLYMNMTKPSENLFLSYSKMNMEGKSMRPSYLIGVIEKVFPSIKIEKREDMVEGIETITDGVMSLASLLSVYRGGKLEEQETLFTLYQILKQIQGKKEWVDLITDAAFYTYQEESLGKEIARELYGQMLHVSVSRLEKFASCAYAHFLQYGLSLKEREEYGFETVDMGNIFHGVLEKFSDLLEESNYTWADFPEEAGENMVEQSLNEYAATYGNQVLFSNERNGYALTRMKRILNRTVKTLQFQLQRGNFIPKQYEVSFSSISDLASLNFQLSKEEKMKLQGRIDRVDTYETEENVYVKVVDYKSGDKNFDLVAMYYGLQLQLVVYLNAAMDLEKRRQPDKSIIPAALLYNHVGDPMIDGEEVLTEEDINNRIFKELRTKGFVNEDEIVLSNLDKTHMAKSEVVPVEYKADGSLGSRSRVMSTKEMEVMSNYVTHKIGEIGRQIISGNIAINPYMQKGREACTFCDYKGVCGFDGKIDGYEKRELEDMNQEEIFQNMILS